MFEVVDKSKYKQYSAFKIHPFYHKTEEMIWAASTVVEVDKVEDLIFCAAATGRDPERYREPKTWDEARKGVGVLVAGGIKEQTIATWNRIQEVLEGVGAKLENIIHRRRFIVHRDDGFDFRATEAKWWQEHCPTLFETRRPGVALKGSLELDLPDMLIQVDTIAVTAKK